MPRKRSNIDSLGWSPKEHDEFLESIAEEPSYMCPICVRLGLNIQNELYNRIELWAHLRLHKLDDLREELVEAICGTGGR